MTKPTYTDIPSNQTIKGSRLLINEAFDTAFEAINERVEDWGQVADVSSLATLADATVGDTATVVGGGIYRLAALPATVSGNWEQLAKSVDVTTAVTAALRGVSLKAPVRAVSLTNVLLSSPGATFDTVTFSNVGVDAVLLAGQSTASQNGIYVWNGPTTPLTRRGDADTSAKVSAGLTVVVTEGLVADSDKIWELQTDGAIVLDTTALTFAPAGGATTGLMNSLSDASSTPFTANFTASANAIHRVDLTSASITGTVPAGLDDRTIVLAKVVGLSGNNALTLSLSGSEVFNKTGGSTSITVSSLNEAVWLYKNGLIWTVIATDTPTSSFYTKTASDLRFKGLGLGTQGLVSPSHLRRWRAALDDALFTSAGIAVFGDSISVGVGSNTSTLDSDYRLQGWVGQLRTLFAKRWGDCGEGFIGSPAVDNGSRWTLSGGATTYGGAGPMHSAAKSASTTQIITVAVPACTQIDFWVWNGGGDGTVQGTYQVDGGSIVSVSAGNGYSDGAVWTKYSVTGLSNTTHTIVFKGPNTGNGFYIVGVSAINQTIGVPVHRVAFSGNTMSNALGLDSTNAGLSAIWEQRLLNAVGVVPAAKLVILALGINDFYQQNNTNQTTQTQPGTTPTTYGTYAQTFCNAAITAGAAVLIAWSPRVDPVGYPSPMNYTEQNYRDVAASIAANTDHVAMLDIGNAWGEVRSAADTLGLTNTGSVHPNRSGHGDMARLLYDTLTSVNLG